MTVAKRHADEYKDMASSFEKTVQEQTKVSLTWLKLVLLSSRCYEKKKNNFLQFYFQAIEELQQSSQKEMEDLQKSKF